MADTPFFRINNRTDWIFVSNAALALANDDFPLLEESFGALGPGVVQHRPQLPLVPDVYLYVNGEMVVVLVQGTEGVAQWVGNILGSPQSLEPSFSGSVCFFFARVALAIIHDIQTIITPLLATRKLVCMGHSLGGAVAQLLGDFFRTTAVNGLSVLAIGAPRVGNPTFAAAIGAQVQRLATVNDPIPSLPPVSWAGPGSAYPVGGPGPAATYQHAGSGWRLDTEGAITNAEVIVPTSEILSQLLTAATPTHAASYYLSALLLDSDLPTQKPGDEGYADPPTLFEATRSNLGLPISARQQERIVEGMDLIQGTMYFRDLEISEGWTEQIYGVTTVDAMLTKLSGLLSPRSLFLSQNIEIHATRAAIVGGAKVSKTIKLASPQRGQVAEDTNEAGDCILYLCRSAGNSKRLMTFRGLPDSWIGKDKLTPAGNAGLASIDSFMSGLLVDSFLNLKTPSLLGLGKQPIDSMANAVPGGPIEVTTAAAHGFSSGDIVSIQGLRGYPYLLNRWKIAVVSATAFTLVGSQRYNISSGAVGTVLGIEYVGTAVTSYGFDSVGHRNTGRPFFQPRGKKSRKVIHS